MITSLRVISYCENNMFLFKIKKIITRWGFFKKIIIFFIAGLLFIKWFIERTTF